MSTRSAWELSFCIRKEDDKGLQFEAQSKLTAVVADITVCRLYPLVALSGSVYPAPYPLVYCLLALLKIDKTIPPGATLHGGAVCYSLKQSGYLN